jgi:hypothetical protein
MTYDNMDALQRESKIKEYIYFFNLHSGGVESKLGPLGTSANYWPIVPAPGNCEDGAFGGMNYNRSVGFTPPTPYEISHSNINSLM